MRQSAESPYFRSPQKREGMSSRMLVIALLTFVLPPLGLLCLWRGARCPLRGKLVLSALGVLSMTLIFMLLIGRNVNIGDALPINYQYPSVSVTQAPAPVTPNNPVVDGNTSSGETPDDGIAPVNPVG